MAEQVWKLICSAMTSLLKLLCYLLSIISELKFVPFQETLPFVGQPRVKEIKFTFPSSAILLLFVFATLFVKGYAICRHQEEMPLSGMETNIKENEKLQWLGFSLRLGCACRVCTDYSCDPKMAFSLAGEPGLLISRVNKKNPFFGYAGSDTHTKSKLLFDVFRKGDVYFNTGDLMFQDQENFVYFWDRLGDTFR